MKPTWMRLEERSKHQETTSEFKINTSNDDRIVYLKNENNRSVVIGKLHMGFLKENDMLSDGKMESIVEKIENICIVIEGRSLSKMTQNKRNYASPSASRRIAISSFVSPNMKYPVVARLSLRILSLPSINTSMYDSDLN